MLMSATVEETLTPNPNKCSSTLTSGTRGIYPHCYILMLMSRVTGYEFAMRSVVEAIISIDTWHAIMLPGQSLVSDNVQLNVPTITRPIVGLENPPVKRQNGEQQLKRQHCWQRHGRFREDL